MYKVINRKRTPLKLKYRGNVWALMGIEFSEEAAVKMAKRWMRPRNMVKKQLFCDYLIVRVDSYTFAYYLLKRG